MTQQPEALRLADELEVIDGLFVKHPSAAELRRLHEANQELLGALENLERTAGHPAMHDDPVRVKARAAIAKHGGKHD